MSPRRKRFWTCTRRTDGVKCNTLNENAKRKCTACGKPKPAARRPKHMVALEGSYEQFVEINGGEFCGICGAAPKTKRLDRDHCHKTGTPRGVLCPICNRHLGHWYTAEWLRAAADYLDRHAARLEDMAA